MSIYEHMNQENEKVPKFVTKIPSTTVPGFKVNFSEQIIIKKDDERDHVDT